MKTSGVREPTLSFASMNLHPVHHTLCARNRVHLPPELQKRQTKTTCQKPPGSPRARPSTILARLSMQAVMLSQSSIMRSM